MAIKIDYYVKKEIHASRTREFIPRVGDQVELKDGLYKVDKITWVDRDPKQIDENFVIIDISPLKKKPEF